MNRLLLGGFLALLAAGLGLFWWSGRAEVEAAAPPPPPAASPSPAPDSLPVADAAGLSGPRPPEATEITKEQQRFFRYDRNRDWRISRNEMLSTRSDGFRKLDQDGNNLLTFEEWAVATVAKFDRADADKDRELTPEEFATTKPKPSARPACRC